MVSASASSSFDAESIDPLRATIEVVQVTFPAVANGIV
jgi:hypothetical protein